MNNGERIKTENGVTGWEEVERLADKFESDDKLEFERPEDNFDVVAEATAKYIHSDFTRRNDYYKNLMTSSTERWYPQIKSSQSVYRAEFEEKMFEKWKQNIVEMSGHEARERFGDGATFDALKKLHNYLKSGSEAKTKQELLNSCFEGDDDGFDVASDKLCYDRHSDPGWMYYSSRDEKIGMEEKQKVDGRLYLNVEPVETFKLADVFVQACDEKGIPYEFKINRQPERSDAMVFYINDENLTQYVDILDDAIAHTGLANKIGTPPLLTERINQYIGYGDEKAKTSYNERQSQKFQRAIEDVARDNAREFPQLSIQDLVRFLYINHHEEFIGDVMRKLH